MFRDVPGYSGMFQNVPECSMFRVLSTALIFGGAYYWKEFCISKWVWLVNKNS